MANMIVKKCEGQCGGLALFWKRGVNVSLRWKEIYHIDVDVKENGSRV
jgi:hypothetical protein